MKILEDEFLHQLVRVRIDEFIQRWYWNIRTEISLTKPNSLPPESVPQFQLSLTLLEFTWQDDLWIQYEWWLPLNDPNIRNFIQQLKTWGVLDVRGLITLGEERFSLVDIPNRVHKLVMESFINENS